MQITCVQLQCQLKHGGLNAKHSLTFRHLLSDQSDPFNRAPLTMDQVCILMTLEAWQIILEVLTIALDLIDKLVSDQDGWLSYQL